MKNLLIGSLVLLAIWSCSNSQNKNTVQHSDDVNQLLKKITNADFKTFVETFTIGKFPFDVSETPLFADGEVPANFHEMSLENVRKLSPDATENKGYYTGYAIFEENYIALIYFYSYSSLFGGDNYHTSVNLLTFSFDGRLIGQMVLGEANTKVNSNAKRESQKMEGNVFADKTSVIKINNYLEEKATGTGDSVNFLIKSNGEIERSDTVSAENKAGENPLAQYMESLPSSEGYVPVRNKDGKWGYVYEDGKVLIECQYQGVSSFDKGKAVVKISSDEDWRKNYHYIDTTGNDLGSFFEKKSGNDTVRSEIVLSSSAEQYFQRVILGNYPGGVMFCGNFGSSGGYKIEESYTFYPEVSFEKIIAAYASLKSDFSAMIKKFEDNPLEYTKGDIGYTESGTKFLTRVQKDANGKISSVRFFKTDLDDFGEKLFFEVKGNGVMVEKSTQLPQR